jgi:tRNA(fMet)-specific endonuclease VapC
MKYLLDTCVISELIRKAPNARVVAWIDGLYDPEVYLSVITIGEIKRGAERLPESERKYAILEWLENDLFFRFERRILPIDAAVMLTWGRLVATLEQRGRPLPAFDSLIAATALSNKLTLATRNVEDFADTGVPIFNPWTDADSR